MLAIKMEWNKNPDAKLHYYDYRGAWQKYGKDMGVDFISRHGTSEFKRKDHPNRFVLDDETGDVLDTRNNTKYKGSIFNIKTLKSLLQTTQKVQ